MATEILGIASYLPKYVMTNAEWVQYLDTSDEWIVSHTGIRERRIAKGKEGTATMATYACQKVLKEAKVSEKDVGLIVVATITPDYLGFPASANLVQAALGVPVMCAAFDIRAACTGFIYALKIASAYIENYREVKYALVIGSETLSRIIDWKDRSTAVLFGDGAAAMLITKSDRKMSLIDCVLRSDGDARALVRPKGGTLYKDFERIEETYLKMDGRVVYNFAVHRLGEVLQEILDRNNLVFDQINYVIPHQANYRIIEAMCNRRGWGINKFYMNLESTGNTSAASIPIALAEMQEKKLLNVGHRIILAGFGAGLTWGAALVQW